MSQTTNPRVCPAFVGWWWRVDRFGFVPLDVYEAWSTRGGWRPTERMALAAAERRVRRAERRNARQSW